MRNPLPALATFLVATCGLLMVSCSTGTGSTGNPTSRPSDAAAPPSGELSGLYQLDSGVSVAVPQPTGVTARYGTFPGEKILLFLPDAGDAAAVERFLLAPTPTPPAGVTFITASAMPCSFTASPEVTARATGAQRRGPWTIKRVTENGVATEVAMTYNQDTSGPDCKAMLFTGFEPDAAGIIHAVINELVDGAVVSWAGETST